MLMEKIPTSPYFIDRTYPLDFNIFQTVSVASFDTYKHNKFRLDGRSSNIAANDARNEGTYETVNIL